MFDKSIFTECKDVSVFDKNINTFFKNIIQNFPEYKHIISKSYKYYLNSDKTEYIDKIITVFEPHIEKISQYDEGIFSNDYSKLPMKLLPGLDFKLIFDFINNNIGDKENNYSIEVANKTKKAIFNYLQSIYLSAKLANNKINDFNKILDNQKTFFKNMYKNLNLDESLKEKIKELEQKEEEENSSGFFEKIKELFNNGALKDILGDLYNDLEPIFNKIIIIPAKNLLLFRNII